MAEPLDPDCQQGKHRACGGHAWDASFDHIVDCGCPCHQPIEQER